MKTYNVKQMQFIQWMKLISLPTNFFDVLLISFVMSQFLLTAWITIFLKKHSSGFCSSTPTFHRELLSSSFLENLGFLTDNFCNVTIKFGVFCMKLKIFSETLNLQGSDIFDEFIYFEICSNWVIIFKTTRTVII